MDAAAFASRLLFAAAWLVGPAGPLRRGRIAPALAGAIYQATGKRLRTLPLDTSQLTA